MLMSVQHKKTAGGESVVTERPSAGGVYASLFKKINLNPVSELSALDIWQDPQAMSDASADERLTAGMQVYTCQLCQNKQREGCLQKLSGYLVLASKILKGITILEITLY